MRYCNKCDKEYPEENFKSKGRCSVCRLKNETKKNCRKYLHRFLSIKYDVIKRRIKTKKQYINKKIKVCFTRDEFVAFGINDDNLILLHNAWVESGFKHSIHPSVDRIDNNGNYEIGNIQFITVSDNTKKRYEKATPTPRSSLDIRGTLSRISGNAR